MNPESSHRFLFQRNLCVRWERARWIERLPVIFRFDHEEWRIDSTANHDLGGAPVRQNVRDVFFHGEVRGVMDIPRNGVFSTEIFQRLNDAMPSRGAAIENDLQAVKRCGSGGSIVLHFADEHVPEARCRQDRRNFRRRRGNLQSPLFVVHLAPILQQSSQTSRTKKCRIAKFYVNRLGAGGNRCEQRDFELIRALAIDAS